MTWSEVGGVCGGSIIKPDFWLVLWLGPEDARPRRALGPSLIASRSELVVQVDFELVLFDELTLLKHIPRRSPAPSSAGEINVYLYS